MAGSLNKVLLIGNVGKDPEIRTTQDGKEIASLTLATSDSWKDKNTGERRERTEWHRIVIFSDGLVNVVKNYVKKGSKLFLEGNLQTRKWTDSAGVERYTTEVVLQGFNCSLTMLDSKHHDNNSGASSGDTSKSKDSGEFLMDDLDDEIPF